MKLISFILCALLPAVMSAGAQTNAQAPAPEYAAGWPGTITHIDDSSFSKPGYLNNVSIHAVRDFMKRFKTTASPRWLRMQDGSCLVKFSEPGINYRVAYNRHGSWVYTVRTYQEKQMPRTVRHLVKSNYYDFSIRGIDEIEQYNIDGPVYIIYQEDDTCYMTLRVCDGEMDIAARLEKKRNR